jgi:hypothetical protein
MKPYRKNLRVIPEIWIGRKDIPISRQRRGANQDDRSGNYHALGSTIVACFGRRFVILSLQRLVWKNLQSHPQLLALRVCFSTRQQFLAHRPNDANPSFLCQFG